MQFKNAFPNNYKIYARACKEKSFNICQLLVTEEESLLYGKKTIINVPIKTDWRKPSKYSYIEKGLVELVKTIK